MVGATDKGYKADWGQTSQDYAAHRPGPPPSFYSELKQRQIGLKNQTIMDLGTGTGVLAREFAVQGAIVSASDISKEQIAIASKLAKNSGLQVNFSVGSGSKTKAPDNSFDIITACQCWWYFDHAKAISEIKRVLKPGGRLVICSFSFLPREDKIVAASEQLVLKYNPNWSGADWNGIVPIFGDTMPSANYLIDKFIYDEAIPFTRESWRGRMRALRGIGASLPQTEVAAFDQEHEKMLSCLTRDKFKILHRIDGHIYQFDKETA